MSSNVRMLHDEIPAYQLAKRARLDQLNREAQRTDRVLRDLAPLWVLGAVITAVLLVLSLEHGWW